MFVLLHVLSVGDLPLCVVVPHYNFHSFHTHPQELHNKELELSRVQQELQIKKKELDAREMMLLELELRIIMNPTPEPNKRKGKFSKTRLKVSCDMSPPLYRILRRLFLHIPDTEKGARPNIPSRRLSPHIHGAARGPTAGRRRYTAQVTVRPASHYQ